MLIRSAAAVATLTALLLAGCGAKDTPSQPTMTDPYTCPDGTVIDVGQARGHDDPAFDPKEACPVVISVPAPPPVAPNEPPFIVLTVTDEQGNVTNHTFVGSGFVLSARGSADTDSGLAQILAVARTVNGTLPVATLFDGKVFTDATMTPPIAGPVNLTVAAMDKVGAVSYKEVGLFVDDFLATEVAHFTLGQPTGSSPTACKGPTGTAADDQLYHKFAFPVSNGTTFVTAKALKGTMNFAICAPDGTALSPASTTSATTTKGTAFTASRSGYFVSAVSTSPLSGTSQNDAQFAVEVHFEPQP